ncbi:MAG: hypothetical protein ABIQ92_13015 [Ornithinibacter sp.]
MRCPRRADALDCFAEVVGDWVCGGDELVAESDHDFAVAAAGRDEAGWFYAGWGIGIVIADHQHNYEFVLVDGLHHVTAGEGANGNERPCPAEGKWVEGSRVCIDGLGAMLLAFTPDP